MLPADPGTKNTGKITAKNIYFALNPSLKISDLSVIKTNPLTGTMSGPVKINTTTNLYHLVIIRRQWKSQPIPDP
jgi:hypothetical protein